MRDHRLAAAEREFVLDQILADLWQGKLTRETAFGNLSRDPQRLVASCQLSEADPD